MTDNRNGLVTLQRRSEFLRVRNGLRWSCATFVVEAKSRDGWTSPVLVPAAIARFGLTVTKKLGGAVERNRIRRRLKSALSQVAETAATPGFDYVVIARDAIRDIVFANLVSELAAALKGVHTRRPATKPAKREAQRGKSSPA